MMRNLSHFLSTCLRLRKIDSYSWIDELPEELTVNRVNGAPIHQISQVLKKTDLLVLPAQRGRYQGKIAVRREPDAIAHRHPTTSIIVVHTPLGTPRIDARRKPIDKASKVSGGRKDQPKATVS